MTAQASRVIVLVCSVGGLDALTRVLTRLPATLPAAVLVLQHQAPDHTSEARPHPRQAHLPPGARRVGGRPPGRRRGAGRTPGKHLLVTHDETLALILSGAFPPNRPSADLLLTSAALALRERGVVVVLSGSGHDAATGATAVHDFGGVVVAADRASSQRSTTSPTSTRSAPCCATSSGRSGTALRPESPPARVRSRAMA